MRLARPAFLPFSGSGPRWALAELPLPLSVLYLGWYLGEQDLVIVVCQYQGSEAA